MTASRAGLGPRPGSRSVVRLRLLKGLLATGSIAAAVVVTAVLVLGVPAARALQWGLLGWGCAIAFGAVARLPVPGLRWPDPPETPLGVGWHGLRSAEARVRREAGRRGTRRPPEDAG